MIEDVQIMLHSLPEAYKEDFGSRTAIFRYNQGLHDTFAKLCQGGEGAVEGIWIKGVRQLYEFVNKLWGVIGINHML